VVPRSVGRYVVAYQRRDRPDIDGLRRELGAVLGAHLQRLRCAEQRRCLDQHLSDLTSQSSDVYLSAGSHANASVVANGSYLSYQWYQNSTSAPVGTNVPSLISGPVSATTSYFAYVPSGSAQTASAPVTARLCNGPQLSALYVSGGSCKNVSVGVAEPSNVCHYEWYKGESGDTSQLIAAGAYMRDLQICPVTATARYWVRVVGTDLNYGDP
jgi:hypothetical protein